MNVFLSRWQTARDCFEEALTFDPASKVIQSNITVCNFYMGKLKEVWSSKLIIRVGGRKMEIINYCLCENFVVSKKKSLQQKFVGLDLC